MDVRSVATVVGGSGFIGRYVVKRLVAAGHVVRVAVRDPEQAQFLKPMGRVGQVVPLFADIGDDATIDRAVDGAGLVVNLVGILAERRRGDFARVQAEGAGRVARIAAKSGVRRLVQMSAIGASEAGPSRYAMTTAAGEDAVRATFSAATILRPSIVFGPEDQFFNRFGAMAAKLPVMPVIAGDTRFQPVYVGDVADAVMQALLRTDAEGAAYELGGPRIMSFREILGWILAQTGRHKFLLPVPSAAARLLASLPFSGITSDQLLSLSRDNIVGTDVPGLAELGILPTPIELIVPDYLARFRRAGARRGLDLVATRT
jgi:NADH dehydrogenase